MHSTALTKPDAALSSEKLIDDALTKMVWYMAYTERQLSRAREPDPEFGSTEIARRRIQVYEAVKDALANLKLDEGLRITTD